MFALSCVNTLTFTFLIKLDSITFFGVDIQVFPQFIEMLDILVSRSNVCSKVAWFNDMNCDSKMPHFNAQWIRKGFYTIFGYTIGCSTWGGEPSWRTRNIYNTSLGSFEQWQECFGDRYHPPKVNIHSSLHFLHCLPFNWSWVSNSSIVYYRP